MLINMRKIFTVERHTLPNQSRFVLVDNSTGANRLICYGDYDQMVELRDMLNEKYKRNPARFTNQG